MTVLSGSSWPRWLREQRSKILLFLNPSELQSISLEHSKAILRPSGPSACGSRCLEGHFTNPRANIQLPALFLGSCIPIQEPAKNHLYFCSLPPLCKLCPPCAVPPVVTKEELKRLETQRESKRKNGTRGCNPSRTSLAQSALRGLIFPVST